MSADFSTLSERLLSATANGVYQGVLIAILAGLALRWLTRTNAATRHAVWFGILVFVTALIPAHLLLSLFPRPEPVAGISRPAAAERTANLAVIDPGDAVGEEMQTGESPGGTKFLPFPDSVAPRAEVEITRTASGEPGDLIAAEIPWWRSLGSAVLKPFSSIPETAITLPHALCLCLVSIWVLLAGIRGGLIVRRILEVRRFKRTSTAPSTGLQARFDQLRKTIVTRRDVRLRLSSTPRTAVLLGFVHPVVLLPLDLDKDATDGEVEHVLRHELAHVERGDDWGNLAQQIVQAALFFHPAIWWISARLSLEREIACDDQVLEASSRPRDYALTLANVARRMIPCRHSLAPGVSNNHSQLQQRINMILNTQRDRSPRLAVSRLGFLTTATAILAVLAIAAGPRLVLAQTPPPAPATPSADTAPATPPSADGPTESGPRPKPETGDIDPAPRPRFAVVATASAAPIVVEVPEPPPAPAIAPVAPVAVTAPVPPVPPVARAGRRHSASVEERLDRIERALEELEARDGMKVRHRTVDGKPMEMNVEADVKRIRGEARLAALDSQRSVDKIEAEQRMVEAAQRAAQAGQRAAQAGQRDAERALRDMEKMKEKELEHMHEKLSELESEAPMKALEALRNAHESLGRQLQAIEKQIKRLEEEQNQPKKPGKHHSDAPEEGQKTDKPAEKTL